MNIGESHKKIIQTILNTEKRPEVVIHKLKIYMLENIEYFNNLIPGLDVAWLAKEIYLQNKKKE